MEKEKESEEEAKAAKECSCIPGIKGTNVILHRR
jgi:hypothetical protein